MTAWLVVMTAAAIVLAAGLVVAWSVWRGGLVRRLRRSRFLVTTVDEESFDGVLTRWDAGFFVYDDVWSVGADGSRVHLDSALWLPRARIKYLQAINP